MTRVVIPLTALLLLGLGEAPRPRITGVAHIALYCRDIQASRTYYTDFLGLGDPSEFKNVDGTLALTVIKVSDRHDIELLQEREANTDRLAHIAFETDDAEGLRAYMKSRGMAVPPSVSQGRDGHVSFSVKDPDGHTVEFVQHAADGRMARDRGTAMGPTAVSSDMRHVGILVGAFEPALRFYGGVLGFTETWRGSRDEKTLNWVNLRVPDGDDYLEFMLYGALPAPSERGSQHHLCLFVPDVERAAAKLAERARAVGYTRPLEVRTGINRKRQLNVFDPDGTRTELMEPTTIDGKPAPSSTARPPR